MRDNASRRALNKMDYCAEKEEGRKEVQYDHRQQYVIARVEHIRGWLLIGFRLGRSACVRSLKRRQIL